MWIYEQATGLLMSPDQSDIFHGYAGRLDGKDNPDAQDQKGIGPLPQGIYRIGAPGDYPQSVGKYALSLTPDSGNQMFGRTSFYIHGDSVAHPGAASHGCIVVNWVAREHIWNSKDHVLEVVRGKTLAESVRARVDSDMSNMGNKGTDNKEKPNG